MASLFENDEVLPLMMSKRLTCRCPGLVPETHRGRFHGFKARFITCIGRAIQKLGTLRGLLACLHSSQVKGHQRHLSGSTGRIEHLL